MASARRIAVPKMKTKKAVAARFRVTGTGKLKKQSPGRRHILTKKTPKRKRQLRKTSLLSGAHLKLYKLLMGV